MFEKAYIQKALLTLQSLGYSEPKGILLKYYRGVRRAWGFYLSPEDFAHEIHILNQAVNRKFVPNDSDQVYIGHLRERFRKNKRFPVMNEFVAANLREVKNMDAVHTKEKVWEAITILKGHNYSDHANAVFRLILETTFLSLNMPIDFLEDYMFDISTSALIKDIRDVDINIYSLTREGDPAAYEQLITYVELVSKTVPVTEEERRQISKSIIGRLLRG